MFSVVGLKFSISRLDQMFIKSDVSKGPNKNIKLRRWETKEQLCILPKTRMPDKALAVLWIVLPEWHEGSKPRCQLTM